jgi:hypothetical protein
MRLTILAAMLTISALAVGCEKKPKEAVEEKPGIEVNAPGVEVKVDPKEGVKVEAPGVDVEAKPKN